MAQSVQNRPGPQGEQEPEDFERGYDPQTTPLGDASDPRRAYNPQATPLGDASDPRSQTKMVRKKPVYDDSGSGYDEESGKGSGVRKGLKRAERDSGQNGFYNDEDDEGEAGTESPSDLSDAEDEAGSYGFGDEDDPGLFNSDDTESRGSKTKRFLKKHKKKIGIGGGIMTGVIGGGLGLFLMLVPLKLEHIVSNLQGSFFSTSQQALGQETRNMVKNYLITRVMPGYKSCGSTIKAGCSARKFGSNPVAEMYRSWADTRLERKLADKGIVLEYKRLSGRWYLETPTIRGGQIDIGASGERLGIEIDNHADLEAGLDKAIKDETKWYQVYTRYKWGRYAERKLGLPRCVVICRLVGGKERYYALHTSFKNKKIMAQLKVVQRVITPHNQALGIALECLLTDCAATDNQPSGSDGENGTPESETDKKIRNALVEYGGSRLTNVSEDELLKNYKEIEEKGLQKYLISKALTPVIGETAAGTAGDVIPIAGWINLAAQIVNAGNDSSGTLKKLRYAVNGAAMAEMAETWLVYADEIHTGVADATEVGSFADSLGPGMQGSTNGPPVGGTASAEQTKLYANLIEKKKGGGTAAAATALLGNPLVGKAYADSATDIASGAAGEVCNNGLPVPANDLICPEDFLGGGNSIANSVHNFLNLPGINVITIIAEGWKHSFGLIFKFGGDLLGNAFSVAMKPANAACGLPSWAIATTPFGPYCGVKDLAEKEVPKIAEGVTKWLIPDPFGVPMGGNRTFVVGAGGFDNLGNDSPHRILGAQALTPVQKAQIQHAYDQEEQLQFSQQSVFARMFDGGSQYSLISKLAMDVPLGGPSIMIQHGFADLMNPLSALGSGFSSIFSGKASAAIDPQADPFGITQYGYPIGTIPGDPEKYWDHHCVDDESVAYQKGNTWNKAASGTANADPNTGEPLNKTVNPCLLIKASVGSAGGLFDTKNLTKDDLADLNGDAGAGAPTGSTPAGSTVPAGGVAFPFPPQVAVVPESSWTQDQGVDIATIGAACGKKAPEVAMGNGVIVGRGISGFGPDAPILHITDGPLKGRYIYYGHAGDAQNSNGAGRPPGTDVGKTVQAGQVITYTGCGDVPSPAYSSGPHLEIGIWPAHTSPDTTFPSMNQTSAEMLGILKNAYKAQGSK